MASHHFAMGATWSMGQHPHNGNPWVGRTKSGEDVYRRQDNTYYIFIGGECVILGQFDFSKTVGNFAKEVDNPSARLANQS